MNSSGSTFHPPAYLHIIYDVYFYIIFFLG